MFENLSQKEWIQEIHQILKRYCPKVKILFESNTTTNSNKYYYNFSNNFIMGNVVFECDKTLYVFQIFTNNNFEYRFSIKNKYFWEIDRTTGKRTKRNTNWVGIYKNTKIHLDQFNKQYNYFFIAAEHIDFEGTNQGLYGINLITLDHLLTSIF